MEIRAGVITFPKGSGPRTATAVFNFSRSVRQAIAKLGSMAFGFSARDDHHLGLLAARWRVQRAAQRAGLFSMKACTPSSAASSIMLQAIVAPASS